MNYLVSIENYEPRQIAAASGEASKDTLTKVAFALLDKVWSLNRTRNIEHDGINLFIYPECSTPSSSFPIQSAVIVKESFTETDEVKFTVIPSGTVAHAQHIGPYSRLGGAHDAIRQWMTSNNSHFAGVFWEVYGHWNDDETKLITDVYYLLQ